MLIEIYSDGSATTGDLPGGSAFVITVNGIKVAEGNESLVRATNNVAELRAAIIGLEYAATHDLSGVDAVAPSGSRPENNGVNEEHRATVVLVSDSQLVLHFADGTWQCKKPHLLPYYLRLRKLYKQLNATTRWVKGHTGDPNNERCDVLAKMARESRANGQANTDDKASQSAD